MTEAVKPLASEADDRYPEILRDLAQHLQQHLELHRGMQPAEASTLAGEVTELVRRHWGGQQIYLSKGQGYEAMHKYLQIWEAFTGDNYAQLARENNLTERQIRNIVSRMRELNTKRTQRDMFAE